MFIVYLGILKVVGFTDKIMNLQSVLKTYGLNEKQAKIYLACLELGSAPVNKIARLSELPRSTCYEILEELKHLGIISTFRKKKIKWFNVEDPRLLVRQAKEKLSVMEEHIPQLLSSYGKSKNRPKIRFYEGKEGMKTILDEILNEATEILAFNSADDLFSILKKEWPKFLKARIANKISVKAILRSTPKGIERQLTGSQELREVRLITNTIDFHGTIFLWKNKIAMFSLQNNLIALVIESPELAQMQKSIFNVLWNLLK